MKLVIDHMGGLGDAVLDTDGNQLVTKGLKTIWIEKTKATAKSLLSPTDWYVVRNAEDNTNPLETVFILSSILLAWYNRAFAFSSLATPSFIASLRIFA